MRGWRRAFGVLDGCLETRGWPFLEVGGWGGGEVRVPACVNVCFGWKDLRSEVEIGRWWWRLYVLQDGNVESAYVCVHFWMYVCYASLGYWNLLASRVGDVDFWSQYFA